MSFTNHARRVRDSSLPHRRRVSSLASCVQLYRPIGFEASLSFLRDQAGPFERDEAALLRALALIERSRAIWHAEIERYAATRRRAKRLGQRSPRPTEPNPHRPDRWYGAARQAAVHALGFWRRHRLPALLVPGDGTAADLDHCVTASLAAGGRLTPEQRELLDACVQVLEQRWRSSDGAEWLRTKDLLEVARLAEMAADADEDSARA
ncbi:hypothetical protein [Streptoalloteichus hindustanus]|uniref:Uncharacterized protein n=1 Tax=Streptoalloteichus hindustanus TaxID=2017 RepID=A0A1M5F4P2_STRHI|nr:hypothetical protein [Streptoalloteichus hindustanus]SHF86570.1 hypothetical protein SAMN05444320_105276 [Streptoalloteichus hindustanus]